MSSPNNERNRDLRNKKRILKTSQILTEISSDLREKSEGRGRIMGGESWFIRSSTVLKKRLLGLTKQLEKRKCRGRDSDWKAIKTRKLFRLTNLPKGTVTN